jgi:hypothetical protein
MRYVRIQQKKMNSIAQMYCHYLGVCDYRRGMDWKLDLLTHLYTPLGTTLYSSLTHTD